MNVWRLSVAFLLGVSGQWSFAAGAAVRSLEGVNGEIQGGSDVDFAIPWYLVFADTAICGGVLVCPHVLSCTAFCLEVKWSF